MATSNSQKSVFIATSGSHDPSRLQHILGEQGVKSFTLEQAVAPGLPWVDSLHKCVQNADAVVAFVGDRRWDANIFFELGYARALNKPALLVIPLNYPMDAAAPSGVPYIRAESDEALVFGVQQILTSRQTDRTERPAPQESKPIGELADRLLALLPQIDSEADLTHLVADAIRASNVVSVSEGHGTEERGVDIAVWTQDLQETVGNPILIEIKTKIQNLAQVDSTVGRMVRSLEGIPNGFGIVMYKEAAKSLVNWKYPPWTLPIAFQSVEGFLKSLRGNKFANVIKILRNYTLADE